MVTQRRKRARVGNGKIETTSAAIALKRLIVAVEAHPLVNNATGRVELRPAPEGKYSALVIHRDGYQPVTYSPRKSARNLELLAEFAHVGLKMTWQQIKEVTGWTTFNT